jgi:hypothetical protein
MELGHGDLVQLKGRSLKGKNRIREMGTVWKVMETQTPLALRGERWCITPVIKPPNPYIRFLHPTQDPDFEVIDVEKARHDGPSSIASG